MEYSIQNWFHIYPWTMDKNYQHLVTLTLATHAMDDVTRLLGRSPPAFSPRHLDVNDVDQTLLTALLEHWQRAYRADSPAHDDVALFRSLNMANSAALLPAGPEATMYDIGRSVALWVSAFEILAPAKHQGVRRYLRLAEESRIRGIRTFWRHLPSLWGTSNNCSS